MINRLLSFWWVVWPCRNIIVARSVVMMLPYIA
jgi:hypothetical protein